MATNPPIYIRYRNPSGLKSLDTSKDADHLFPSAEAKHDRLQITVRVAILVPQLRDRDIAIDELLTDRGGVGPDFLRLRATSSANSFRVSIAQNAWLFSGRGAIQRQRNSNVWVASLIPICIEADSF